MQVVGISKQLTFINKNVTYKTTLSFYKLNENTGTNLHDLLHIKEIHRASNYPQEKRKNSYLLGRISAKLAIKKYLDLTKTNSFYIDNGVFNQPIIVGLHSPYFQISLSHTQDIGIAIVYDESHPMGIDIESVDDSSSKDVMSILSQNEKDLLKQVDPLILWTAKESLSKCLKTGLTIPFDWFEVNKIIELKENCFEIYFLNLNQFKATVFMTDQYIVACSYHIDSVTNLKEWFDIQNSLAKYQTN